MDYNKQESLDNDDIYVVEEEKDLGAPLGLFGRFISIFLSPVKLMENLAVFPKLGAASLYILILSLASGFLSLKAAPIVMEAQSLVIAQRYGMDFMNMTQSADAIQSIGPVALALTCAALVGTMFFYAVVSSVLMLILTKIMGGGANFSKYFSLNLHLTVLGIVGGIISAGIMLATGSYMSFTSLAPVFMPEGDFTMPVFNLLSSIEVFGIWSAILTVIGIKKMNDGFSAAKAVTLGVILYILGVAAATAIASSSVFFYDMSYNAMQGF